MGDEGGGLLLPALLVGGVTLGYVYREELGLSSQFDAVLDWIKERFGGGVTPGCTKTCTGATHLDAASCQCVPNTCTKTCTPPQVLNATACKCETAVSPGGTTSWAAAGDWGSGRNSNWKGVVALMAAMHPTVILVPGDMSYSGGVAKMKPVTDAMRKISPKPLIFGAQGNHDSGDYGSLFDMYSNGVRTVGNTSFMSLNSNSTSSAVSYFKANVNKMTAKWKVVFFHHPVRSVKSDHGTDGSPMALVPEFEKAHINAVVGAHNHIYLRYAKTSGGVTYFVSGLGGEGPYSLGANCSGCPAVAKAYNSKFGTLFVQGTSASMSGRFVAVDNKVIDNFTL